MPSGPARTWAVLKGRWGGRGGSGGDRTRTRTGLIGSDRTCFTTSIRPPAARYTKQLSAAWGSRPDSEPTSPAATANKIQESVIDDRRYPPLRQDGLPTPCHRPDNNARIPAAGPVAVIRATRPSADGAAITLNKDMTTRPDPSGRRSRRDYNDTAGSVRDGRGGTANDHMTSLPRGPRCGVLPCCLSRRVVVSRIGGTASRGKTTSPKPGRCRSRRLVTRWLARSGIHGVALQPDCANPLHLLSLLTWLYLRRQGRAAFLARLASRSASRLRTSAANRSGSGANGAKTASRSSAILPRRARSRSFWSRA